MARSVFLEKSWLKEAGVMGAVGIFHYAVKVGDDWYEVSGKNGGGRCTINGKFDGRPNRIRESKIRNSMPLVGATEKTDSEIVSFNRKWLKENPMYHLALENCQKYAMDLIRFLVGASCKVGLPFCALNDWADGPGAHAVLADDHYQARATTGKIGSQTADAAFEAEGPSAGVDVSDSYVGVEASLGRAEAKLLVVGARLEPNVNTGIGATDGLVKAKALGFGLSIGNGFGIHTPLGSLGFGNF